MNRAAAVLAVIAVSIAVLLGGATNAQAHTSSEIQRATEAWLAAGAPYDGLTPASQRLVTASTWRAWLACGGRARGITATVRGHGNDLAVVRFTSSFGTHMEWTAFYRGGRWTYELPSVDVAYLRTHTASEVARCA